MFLIVIRSVFLLVAGGLATRLAYAASEHIAPWAAAVVWPGVMIASTGLVLVDVFTQRKRIQTVSAIYFGLMVGMILSFFLRIALEPTFEMMLGADQAELMQAFFAFLTVAICYICVSMLLQTKDDFRFIIPYMEFSKNIKGSLPLILDTSVIIDGRIADVAESRILDQPLVVPQFVLQELQGIADSSDKLRRNRGRRGLDILNRLQKSDQVEIRIFDSEIADLAGVREVDQRLVVLAKHLAGKVVTNDYNLNKIARLQGVDVINLNDVANALKPVVLPGEMLSVKLIKRGEEPGQGVGYLDDGTMVVTEHGAHHIGEIIRLTVTSVLQTSAGRMIFGRLDNHVPGHGVHR